jgi:hypothetical protein
VEDYVLQKISLERGEITGVRLRFAETTPSTTIKMCLYGSGDIKQEPLECVSRNTDEQVENQVIFFIFNKKVSLDVNSGEIAQ